VSIGVAHESDPEAVHAALLEAARRSGFAPGGDGEGAQVAFEEIGESAFGFSISVPLADGASVDAAETALRTQAIKTLRERGIAIASPQRQVRLRDLEGLRGFVMKLAEERARNAQAGDDAAVPAPPRKPNGD
jgi:small-conductance mechanosensitive channel